MKISSIHFLMALAMLLPGITAFADNAVIEVNYEIHQRLYVEDEELATDQMVLLIGENSSIFKSATAELRRQQRDSIAKATINQSNGSSNTGWHDDGKCCADGWRRLLPSIEKFA